MVYGRTRGWVFILGMICISVENGEAFYLDFWICFKNSVNCLEVV